MTTTVLDDVSLGRYALLLPGAGSQLPSMARRLCRSFDCATEVLERAAKATGLDLVRLCREGTPAELTTAEVAHPAIVATGLAAAAALRRHLGGRWAPPAVVGGHSLGHFAALVEAGCLDFDDALRLVARRARLMTEQTRSRPALMASLAGAPPERVTEWCAACPPEHGVVVPACFNGPVQTVVSGDAAAVRWVGGRAGAEDGLRVKELPAGVASHSPLMKPVQRALRSELAAVPLSRPAVPLLLNSTGQVTRDVDALRTDLLDQLSVPVRWNDAMRALVASGITTVLDSGPGQVLARAAALHPELDPVALNFMHPLERAVPLP
ncbi:ACP S-malonyltransferase [Streptomyces pimonensis]|uniref:Malonyl CoA-acyl carrier protein transacylase n=1 Tax=Streptomyces pimonensis TaxID=2860288 RepID=A0ABV4JAY8_9ACTN